MDRYILDIPFLFCIKINAKQKFSIHICKIPSEKT